VGMMQQGIKLWQQHPFLGGGFAAFERLSGYETYAHNNFVELLCNTGVLGLLLYYAIYVYTLLKASRLPGVVRLYCWSFVLLLLALDMGYVSYDRKQTVMILMLLMSFVSGFRLPVPEGWRSWAGDRAAVRDEPRTVMGELLRPG
jgi:O-antigen ligase